MKNIAIDINDELLEHFRWYDIPDCKKYKELLESKDKEVIRLAIELLTVDGVEKRQIDRCRGRFLHEYRWDEKWCTNIVWYEPKHNVSVVPIVV